MNESETTPANVQADVDDNRVGLILYAESFGTLHGYDDDGKQIAFCRVGESVDRAMDTIEMDMAFLGYENPKWETHSREALNDWLNSFPEAP